MGINLSDLAVKKEVSYDFLKGKSFVVDASNVLYQFLSSIRQMDGSPLTDSKGRVTSHLVGLFNRTTRLMIRGLRLAFVFDGKAPELKAKEREKRAKLKEEAEKQYEIAEKRKDVELMKKYASRTSKLTREMMEEAKELICALGMPAIQAPSEAEAQAAYMVKKGEFFAEVSQDYDCLLFGVPRMVQNLTISEKKKVPSRLIYEKVVPVIIELKDTLKSLDINQDQLIALGLLVGTDFNVGGIKGIGPKNALKLVKQYKDDFNKMFNEVKWNDYFDYPWQDVFDLFKNMPVTDNYVLKWNSINEEKIMKILVDEHDFSKERVQKQIDELRSVQRQKAQKGLADFS